MKILVFDFQKYPQTRKRLDLKSDKKKGKNKKKAGLTADGVAQKKREKKDKPIPLQIKKNLKSSKKEKKKNKRKRESLDLEKEAERKREKKRNGKRSKECICSSCLKQLENRKIPKLSIANELDFGEIPQVLKRLNEVEKNDLIGQYFRHSAHNTG